MGIRDMLRRVDDNALNDAELEQAVSVPQEHADLRTHSERMRDSFTKVQGKYSAAEMRLLAEINDRQIELAEVRRVMRSVNAAMTELDVPFYAQDDVIIAEE